jgi:hypothetical protein
MNNEQVMEIMESLGLHKGGIENWVPDNAWVKVANAVEAAEREACIKFFEDNESEIFFGAQAAAALRAKGQALGNLNKQAEQNGEEL